MNIAIVGATGNVGRKVLEVLERKNLPFSEIYLVASPTIAIFIIIEVYTR